jgi:hypothetical protein
VEAVEEFRVVLIIAKLQGGTEGIAELEEASVIKGEIVFVHDACLA